VKRVAGTRVGDDWRRRSEELIAEVRNRNGTVERDIGIGVAGILGNSESNDSTPVTNNFGNVVDDVDDVDVVIVVADVVVNGCVTVSVSV
jgi:hypothetical protein